MMHSYRNFLDYRSKIEYLGCQLHGVHSSVWLERQVVALEVVGSSPTGHPMSIQKEKFKKVMAGTFFF